MNLLWVLGFFGMSSQLLLVTPYALRRVERWIPDRFSNEDFGAHHNAQGSDSPNNQQQYLSYYWPEYFPANGEAGGQADYSGMFRSYDNAKYGGVEPVQQLPNVQTYSYPQLVQSYPYQSYYPYPYGRAIQIAQEPQTVIQMGNGATTDVAGRSLLSALGLVASDQDVSRAMPVFVNQHPHQFHQQPIIVVMKNEDALALPQPSDQFQQSGSPSVLSSSFANAQQKHESGGKTQGHSSGKEFGQSQESSASSSQSQSGGSPLGHNNHDANHETGQSQNVLKPNKKFNRQNANGQRVKVNRKQNRGQKGSSHQSHQGSHGQVSSNQDQDESKGLQDILQEKVQVNQEEEVKNERGHARDHHSEKKESHQTKEKAQEKAVQTMEEVETSDSDQETIKEAEAAMEVAEDAQEFMNQQVSGNKDEAVEDVGAGRATSYNKPLPYPSRYNPYSGNPFLYPGSMIQIPNRSVPPPLPYLLQSPQQYQYPIVPSYPYQYASIPAGGVVPPSGYTMTPLQYPGPQPNGYYNPGTTQTLYQQPQQLSLPSIIPGAYGSSAPAPPRASR